VQRACTQVFDAAHERRLIGDVVAPILIVPDLTVEHPRSGDEMPSRLPAITLHDPDRDAFKAYKVMVVPTVVVVGPRGQVVSSIAGYNPRFRQMLTASLLFAAGKESRREFERVMDAGVEKVGPETMRAARLTQMGDELMQEGLFGWAASRYNEACLLDLQSTPAALGAGAAMLRLHQYDDADERFAGVLSWAPECLEAQLGLAEVELRRGGDAARVEELLRRIVEVSPTHARAHLLLGEVLERRGDAAGAAASFRRAAELALGHRAPE
jgi:thioredoxin-like negative regulator of GroEL